MKRPVIKKILLIGGGVLFVAAIAASVYFYTQYRKSQTLLKDTARANEEELANLKEKIGKHFLLPTDEEPVLATVSDKEKLKDQPFFTRSENGDKVLIYEKAQRAFLYRPSIDKLVDVAALNSTETAKEETPVIEGPVSVILRNGTLISGLTNKVSPKITGISDKISILRKENAARTNYEGSVVVVINQSAADAAKLISTKLGIPILPLPNGEKSPTDADLLVIIGSDLTE
jgi:hypothetical protein